VEWEVNVPLLPSFGSGAQPRALTIPKKECDVLQQISLFFFLSISFYLIFARSADLIYVSQQHDSCSLDFSSF
jgi:hypothetical protein